MRIIAIHANTTAASATAVINVFISLPLVQLNITILI